MLSTDYKREDYKICVASVLGTEGVQGRIKLKIFTAKPEDIELFSELYDEENRTFKVHKLKMRKDHIVVAIDGVNSREEAEKLRNLKLYVYRSSLPELNGDEYYHADLYGMQVIFTNGEKVGFVEGIVNFGAGDIIQVKTQSGKSVFYPFSRQFVVAVNVEERCIMIQPLEEVLATNW